MSAATRFDASAFATPANLLTLSRIALAPPLFVLILLANDRNGVSWAAFVLGLVVALTDNFDGRLARRQGTTRSGAFLDPLADKIVVIGVMVCLVGVGRYWWLPVALVAAREAAISAWRTYWARRGLAIPARRSAKYKTLVQGVALLIAVLPPLEDADRFVGTVLWIAVAFTIVTGLQYAMDGRNALSRTGD
ncbi:MAG TPA: CDP-alcohol phosphatidyltransferase family protein [Acidimicrobiales bacterium]|nr:CDP-alcohol phosphatidyltransferase family protein [Acidimicrobiales bacterium]